MKEKLIQQETVCCFVNLLLSLVGENEKKCQKKVSGASFGVGGRLLRTFF
jgi:hypothetical protein